jgi:hypothetical protein
VNLVLDLTIQTQGKGKEKFGEDPPLDAQKANVRNPSSPMVVIRSPIGGLHLVDEHSPEQSEQHQRSKGHTLEKDSIEAPAKKKRNDSEDKVAKGQASIVKRSKTVGSGATRRDIDRLISGAKPTLKLRLPLLSAVAFDSASFVNSKSNCFFEGTVGEASPFVS